MKMNFELWFQGWGISAGFGPFAGFDQRPQVMCKMCSYSSKERLSTDSPSPSTRSRAQIGPAPRGRAPTFATDKVGAFAPAQQMAVTAVPKCLLSEPGRDAEGQAEGSALIFLSPVHARRARPLRRCGFSCSAGADFDRE